MDLMTLFIGFVAGAIGIGYCIYGKRQQMYMPMVAGAALCAMPYFVDNLWVLLGLSLAALVAPFLFKF